MMGFHFSPAGCKESYCKPVKCVFESHMLTIKIYSYPPHSVFGFGYFHLQQASFQIIVADCSYQSG